jgi:transcriptional regulator with XRE-family HTH domain
MAKIHPTAGVLLRGVSGDEGLTLPDLYSGQASTDVPSPVDVPVPTLWEVVLVGRHIDGAFGAKLRELRTARGLTVRDLEKVALISRTRISSYENGKGLPTRHTAELLDAAVGANGDLVALLETADAHESGGGWGSALRRAAQYVPPALPLQAETRLVSRLSPETARGLAEIAVQYRRAYHMVPAAQLLPAASAHLDLILSVHPERQAPEDRRRLLTAAGEMATLTGVLLGLDATQYRSSLSYLDVAWQAARMAEDIDLMAVILGCRSFAVSYGGRDDPAGLDCADMAREVAATGA